MKPVKPETSKVGLRYNKDKTERPALRSPFAMRALDRVLAMGAKKYAARNWEKGLSYTETLDSLLRHLTAFQCGQRYDAESGEHHLTHVLWNAMVLLHFELLSAFYSKFNDLPAYTAPAPSDGSDWIANQTDGTYSKTPSVQEGSHTGDGSGREEAKGDSDTPRSE